MMIILPSRGVSLPADPRHRRGRGASGCAGQPGDLRSWRSRACGRHTSGRRARPPRRPSGAAQPNASGVAPQGSRVGPRAVEALPPFREWRRSPPRRPRQVRPLPYQTLDDPSYRSGFTTAPACTEPAIREPRIDCPDGRDSRRLDPATDTSPCRRRHFILLPSVRVRSSSCMRCRCATPTWSRIIVLPGHRRLKGQRLGHPCGFDSHPNLDG